jgi:hypothetical protein
MIDKIELWIMSADITIRLIGCLAFIIFYHYFLKWFFGDNNDDT